MSAMPVCSNVYIQTTAENALVQLRSYFCFTELSGSDIYPLVCTLLIHVHRAKT